MRTALSKSHDSEKLQVHLGKRKDSKLAVGRLGIREDSIEAIGETRTLSPKWGVLRFVP